MFRVNGAEFLQAFTRLEPEIEAATRQAVGQSVAYAWQLARTTDKFKDRTGKLRERIVRGQRGPWTFFVKAGDRRVKYAQFVESGTSAHEIRPKRAGVLRFVVAGRIVFARKVKHPGTSPTHFMQNARDKAEDAAVRFVETGISNVITQG